MSQAGMAGSTSGGGSRIITTLNVFDPNVKLQEFDDFLGGYGGSDTQFSKLGWTNGPTTIKQLDGTTDHPGIWMLDTESSLSNGSLFMRMVDAAGADTGGNLALGGGTLTSSFIIRLSALSAGGDTYVYSCGLADSATLFADSDSFVDGVYFQYTDSVNAGNWQIKSTASSVTTTANTSTAATTGWVTLTVAVNAGATAVNFYIDGNLVANSPITTNIPTAALVPFIFIKNTAGTTPNSYVDLYYIMYNLTNARPGPTGSSTILGVGMLIEQYVQTAISYQVLNTDAIIGVSSTAAPRTITMPASSLVTGQRWTIKDESGGAAANNITISGNGKNIDGAATYVITTNYGAVDIYYNGTNFFLI